MNKKIYVGAAIGALGAFVLLFASPALLSQPSQEQTVLPLQVELHNLSVLEVDERSATLEIKFKVSNPNFKSVMLQHIKYSVYHNDARIAAGEVGTAPEGFLASPNYYIILNERPSLIGEKFTITNTGNTPELWETLAKNELNWRVSGEAFFNLSSITAGQENILKFDFSKYD